MLAPLAPEVARRELAGEGGLAWASGAPSAEDLVVLGIAAEAIPTWLIMVAGRCVGMIGTHEPLAAGSTPEIGYHVAEEARGGGVATQAVGLLLEELARVGVAGVVAEVDPRSELADASLGVLRANGFEHLDDAIVTQLFVDPVEGAVLLHRSLP